MSEKKIFAGPIEIASPERGILSPTVAQTKLKLDLLSPSQLEQIFTEQYKLDLGKSGKDIERTSALEAIRNYPIVLIQGVNSLVSRPDTRSDSEKLRDINRLNQLAEVPALKKLLAYYYIFNLGKNVSLANFDVQHATEQYVIADDLALKQENTDTRNVELRKTYSSASDVYQKIFGQTEDEELSADQVKFEKDILFPMLMKRLSLVFAKGAHGFNHDYISRMLLDADYIALGNHNEGETMRDFVSRTFDKYVRLLEEQGNVDLVSKFRQTVGYKMITHRLDIMAEWTAVMLGNNFPLARKHFLAAMNIVNQMAPEDLAIRKRDTIQAYLLTVSKLYSDELKSSWAQQILLPILKLDTFGNKVSIFAELLPLKRIFEEDVVLYPILKKQLDFILDLFPTIGRISVADRPKRVTPAVSASRDHGSDSRPLVDRLRQFHNQ